MTNQDRASLIIRENDVDETLPDGLRELEDDITAALNDAYVRGKAEGFDMAVKATSQDSK